MTSETISAAARRIAPEFVGRAVPDGYPYRHAAQPVKWVINAVRHAAWPVVQITIELPQRTSDGRASKPVAQVVSVVPRDWLRELADRLVVEWAVVCRREVG